MAAEKKGEFTEELAKAEIRAAPADVERGGEALNATIRRLKAMPDYKRVPQRRRRRGRACSPIHWPGPWSCSGGVRAGS
jgi:hypothetical protein